jgi:hypothetical protein
VAEPSEKERGRGQRLSEMEEEEEGGMSRRRRGRR